MSGILLHRPPAGWRLRDTAGAKAVIARLIAGEAARLTVEAGPMPDWLKDLKRADDAPLHIILSTRADAAADLIYAPQLIALGIGCERLAESGEVVQLVAAALAEANVARAAIGGVGSIATKAAEPAIHALADELGIAAQFFDAARLKQETPRLQTPSELVYRKTGCHGVAEGAALALAGADGALILPKRRSLHATCALVRAQAPIGLRRESEVC